MVPHWPRDTQAAGGEQTVSRRAARCLPSRSSCGSFLPTQQGPGRPWVLKCDLVSSCLQASSLG